MTWRGIEIWRHKTNARKHLEIHKDGYYHYSVKQFILTDDGDRSYTGDRCLHRWRKKDLCELLKDYHYLYDDTRLS